MLKETLQLRPSVPAICVDGTESFEAAASGQYHFGREEMNMKFVNLFKMYGDVAYSFDVLGYCGISSMVCISILLRLLLQSMRLIVFQSGHLMLVVHVALVCYLCIGVLTFGQHLQR